MKDIPAGIKNLYYRGRLDACNYTCSYCPFAKKKMGRQKLLADQRAFEHFFERVKNTPACVKILLIPYGEVLAHSFYRDGMIRLARLPNVEGIACQTNLSFDVEKFLKAIAAANAGVCAQTGKIKLWASFHPEILTTRKEGIQKFLDATHRLAQNGVELSVGAVALAKYRTPIADLRQRLDPRLYLFLNMPRGAARGDKTEALSPEDRAFFHDIDPLFACDERRTPADIARCKGGRESLFIDADGRDYACPRSGIPLEDETPRCRRKTCDCYIAYSNLHPRVQAIMGDGALWRIPQKRAIAALFFDIDGTLTDAAGKVPPAYARSLAILARQMPLFLATALPLAYARMRLGALFDLFSGGAFAAGAHVSWRTAQQTHHHFIPCPLLPDTLPIACRVSSYANGRGEIFKYALTTGSDADACRLQQYLHAQYTIFREGNLVTLVHREVDKATGVRRLCQNIHIDPKEIAVIGDSEHDLPMFSLTPYACAVPNASGALKAIAWLILTPDRLPAFFTGR
ncbi:MAG: STM4011 family radical SAM protein [Zoogloeaceae bacterium]|jgi:phosphoserine phosphatase|nr:STM4011 family radical SAM protein [Zoogloeaceae bacterium]